ncbi:flagellar basal body rod protein FlgC [Euzebya rosea]|uniref:flagellar basal body rod protein FlgC n=1 Tax=Euzebya rosea TaxID=2052804 RepID=UPI000D3E3642|nr:flagellar basal body rod C-terminal domain-containing protein [Euzebya rosea]
MSMFGAISTAHSGLRVHRTWLDATSDNIANLNTVRSTDEPAFQARYVMAQAVEGAGARVAGVEYGSAEGRLAHQPDHPLADADGMVRLPDMDMGSQMTSLMLAQRGYQANLSVVETARDAYRAALQLGRS